MRFRIATFAVLFAVVFSCVGLALMGWPGLVAFAMFGAFVGWAVALKCEKARPPTPDAGE